MLNLPLTKQQTKPPGKDTSTPINPQRYMAINVSTTVKERKVNVTEEKLTEAK